MRCQSARQRGAYGDHGEQDVAGGSGFEGGDWRVDQRIDRGGGEDEAGGKEADNLLGSAGACAQRCVGTYGDMVGPLSVRCDRHGDADDAEEHEDQGPPCEVGEAAVDGGYYAGDKGNDPGELWRSVRSGAWWLLVSNTHNADGDGGQGERVADDAANAEGRGALAGVAVAVS